jgi:hypothetical protein
MSKNAIPVPKRFTKKFPDLSPAKANKLWDRYLTVVAKYTMKQYLSLSVGTYINFPYKKAIDECSTFNYKKKRYYIWKEFGEGAGFIQRIKKGSNLTHQNSEIVITNTKQFQFFVDTKDANEILNIYYGDIDDTTEFDYVPIDMLSLEHYIRSTEREVQNKNNSQALINTLEKNLLKAKTIEIIATHFNNELPQRISSSHYGRRYYKGINLQNCHKTLRHACLGKCFEYDLKAAVYAIKLMLAKDIFDKVDDTDYNFKDFFPRTKEYMEQKDFIRETLAEILTNIHKANRVKLVKQVITAVGFGATASSPSWSGSAIASIVMNKQNRIDLLNNKWLAEFIDEQKDLTNFIVDYYLADKQFTNSIKDMGKIKVGNQYNKKQVMSYIFQTLEYQIMNEIAEHIGKNYGLDPDDMIQLRVHDAIYTKKEISAEDLCDIKLTLEQFSEYLVLEHNKKKDRHIKFKDLLPSKQEIIEHKELIKQAEILAKDYDNNYADDINVKGIIAERKYEQKMLDTQTYKQMNHAEQQEYKRIMNITKTNGDMPGSVYKLLNENK